MDKNTIIGLVIIFLILIGFSYLTKPSEEQVREMQRQQDSIARVEQRRRELAAEQQQKEQSARLALQPTVDSLFAQQETTEKIITLENNKVKLHISTQGGRIVYVDLKEYRTHDSLPLD